MRLTGSKRHIKLLKNSAGLNTRDLPDTMQNSTPGSFALAEQLAKISPHQSLQNPYRTLTRHTRSNPNRPIQTLIEMRFCVFTDAALTSNGTIYVAQCTPNPDFRDSTRICWQCLSQPSYEMNLRGILLRTLLLTADCV